MALRRIVPGGTLIDYGNAFASSPFSKFGRPFCQRLSIVLIGEACSDWLTISPQNRMRTKCNDVAQSAGPMPENISSCEEFFTPCTKITLRRADTSSTIFCIIQEHHGFIFLLIDK